MKRLLLLIILGCSLMIIYSRYEGTTNLEIKEFTLNDNITESYQNLKIVHFSDLHYGRIITLEQINEVVKTINEAKPDIVVFTGDLIDKDFKIKDSDKLEEILSQIDSKYGNYTILGEDDYQNEEEVIKIWNNSNFIILNNNYDIIYNENNDTIFLGGLGSSLKKDANLDTTMEYLTNNKTNYQILLIHEPDYFDNITSKYSDVNLVLAGHSHLGQVRIPMIGPVKTEKGYKKYYNDQYHVGNTNLYVTGGIGVANYNFRLFNNPQINIYYIK